MDTSNVFVALREMEQAYLIGFGFCCLFIAVSVAVLLRYRLKISG